MGIVSLGVDFDINNISSFKSKALTVTEIFDFITNFNQRRRQSLRQLEELNDICGGDWRNLYWLIPTGDSKKMMRLNVKEAKQEVIKYFKNVLDMMKRKQIHPVDVTMKDLIARIKIIVSREIHWACLIYRLLQAEKLKLDDLVNLFMVVGDFETFWTLLSMPHYTLENIQRNGYEVFDSQVMPMLKQLNNFVIKQDEDENLPEEIREKNKLCKFLDIKSLCEMALSVGDKRLVQKFKQLSTMQVDKNRLKIYLKSKGMEMIEQRKVPDEHLKDDCLLKIQYIENFQKVGLPISRPGMGHGTLGFPVAEKIDCPEAITSSHVMLTGELVDLPEKDGCRSMKKWNCGILLGLNSSAILCFQADKMIGYVTQGHYKTGDSFGEIGFEIVVLRMSEKQLHASVQEHYEQNKSLQDLLILNWICLEPEIPRRLQFRGRFITHKDMQINTVVYKIGAKTGLTKGRLISKEYKCQMDHPFDKEVKFRLFNQYEIKWDDDFRPFSKSGDSGAPVFILDRDSGDLFAVGVLTGCMSEKKISCVTPICAIMEALGKEYSLSPFEICLKKVKGF